MNKIIKNKIFVIILSFFTLFCTTFGGLVNAEGQNFELALEQVCFFMQDGASVRTVKDSSGLRFTSLISKTDYNGLISNENYKSLKFGMLILPYDYVTNYGAVNYESVFGENSIYGFNGEKDKIQIINLVGDRLCEFVYDKNYMAFNGVIINIFESNFCRQFVGVGYIAAQTNSGFIYKFASGNDNVRSVVYVAGKATEHGGYDGEALEVLQNYLEKSSDVKTNYTVKTHLCGSSESVTEQTFETTVGSTVTAVNSDINGYVFDADHSITSAVALANNVTVLDLYYQSNENCIVDLRDEVCYTFDLSNNDFVLDTSKFYGGVEKIGSVAVTEVDGKITVDKNTLLSLCTKRLDDYSGTGGEFLWSVVTSCRTYKIKVILADKIIKTAQDFSMLNNNSAGYYILGNDVFIDGELKITQFDGVLNGKGHKISDVTVPDGKGIFATVGESGVIKNVAFVNVTANCCFADTFNGKAENVYVHSNNAQTAINNEYGAINGLVCNLPNGKFVFRIYNPSGDAVADNIYAIVGKATGNENHIGICNNVQSQNGLSNTICATTAKNFLSVLTSFEGFGNYLSGNGSTYLKFGNNYVITQ